MGADSYVIVISKHRDKLAKYYDYSSDYYFDIPNGTLILSQLLLSNATDESRELFVAFEADMGDFATHDRTRRITSRVLSNIEEWGISHGKETEVERFKDFWWNLTVDERRETIVMLVPDM